MLLIQQIPNMSKKNEHVRDDDIESMKVKPDEEASTQAPRKKSGDSHFMED